VDFSQGCQLWISADGRSADEYQRSAFRYASLSASSTAIASSSGKFTVPPALHS
jgi:hypothetical protein